MNGKTIFFWAIRLIPAVIFVQTLYFKFTGAPEPIYIFETLGQEPYGRIGTGVLELIAAILLLIPRTSWLGAGLGVGLMSGAILAHLTVLGIEVKGDGGLLFGLGIAAFICCALVLWRQRVKIPVIGNQFK